MNANRISPSALNIFDNCQWQYHAKYDLGLKSGTNDIMTAGIMVHDVLEEIGKELKRDGESPLLEALAEVTVAHMPPAISNRLMATFEKQSELGEITEACTDRARDNLVAVADQLRRAKAGKPVQYRLFQGQKILRSEKLEEMELPDPEGIAGDPVTLLLKMDLVEEMAPGFVMITDYKTGARLPSKKDELTDPQATIYCMYWRLLDPKVEDVSFAWLFPKAGYFFAKRTPGQCDNQRLHLLQSAKIIRGVTEPTTEPKWPSRCADCFAKCARKNAMRDVNNYYRPMGDYAGCPRFVRGARDKDPILGPSKVNQPNPQ